MHNLYHIGKVNVVEKKTRVIANKEGKKSKILWNNRNQLPKCRHKLTVLFKMYVN